MIFPTGCVDIETQFAFESRMVDRLTMMLGLLPATHDEQSSELFE
ncbi:hypothetical protein ACXPVS_11980 [Pseudomonas sp. Ma2-10]